MSRVQAHRAGLRCPSLPAAVAAFIPAGTRLKKPRNGLSIGTGFTRAHEKEIREIWNKMMRKKK